MKRAALGTKSRTVLALLLAIGLFSAQATSAFGAEQTAVDNKDVDQTEVDQRGDATGDGAQSGQAVTFSDAIVNQQSIQVIAGPGASNPKNAQIALNDADIDQTTAAVTGNADAENGGTAKSGNAVAGSLAIVHQLNIQIIAGWTPSDGVQQGAANVADIDQTSVAGTGEASADGSGSTAKSGDATALDVQVVQQRNIQIYVGKGPKDADEAAKQTAANIVAASQEGTALTGNADAADDSDAESGDARSRLKGQVKQANAQVGG